MRGITSAYTASVTSTMSRGSWFPIALFPFLAWWFKDHGYQWALIHQKSCFLIPWCLAPWMGYMTAVYCG